MTIGWAAQGLLDAPLVLLRFRVRKRGVRPVRISCCFDAQNTIARDLGPGLPIVIFLRRSGIEVYGVICSGGPHPVRALLANVS